MASATGRVDELVKDYLIYRGLTTTYRTFEAELKNEKEKGLRADRILEQLQTYVVNYDLSNLREYWSYLNQRLFSRLETRYLSSVRKLEVGLLKFYLVNAQQLNRHDRVTDFFEKMTPELQNQTEFKDWFAFAFMKNPEEHSNFSMYFTKQWQDTFFLSLYNFLSVIIQTMPSPVLLNFDIEHKRMKDLQEENEKLKQQLRFNNQPVSAIPKRYDSESSEGLNRTANSLELVYDFSGFEDDTVEQEKQQKTGRKFFKMPATPLVSKKPATKVIKKTEPAIEQQPMSSSPLSRQRGMKQLISNNQNKHPPNRTNSKLETGASKSPKDLNQGQEMSLILDQVERTPAVDNNQSSVEVTPVHQKIQMKQKDFVKERQELLGDSGKQKKHNQKSISVGDTLSSSSAQKEESLPEVPQRSQSQPAPETPPIKDVKCSDETDKCPFLLLSQEDYIEHRAAISYSKFSNTGQYIASVDVDGVVKVWSWSPQPTTAATVMSKSAFLSVEWTTKSDRWLLLGNRSGNIRLFDVKEMKSFYEASADASYPRIISLCSNPAGGSFVCSASVHRSRSASGSSELQGYTGKVGKLSYWDLRTMKMIQQLNLDPGPVAINCCSYNHNGQLLLAGAADGMIRLFDMQQNNCISQWEAHNGEVLSLQFSSDENMCYSLGTDEKFYQWNIHKPDKSRELPLHSGAALPFLSSGLAASKEIPKGRLFAFDPEGQYLISCDKMAGSLYKIKTGENALFNRVMEVKGHTSSVTTVDWSPNIDTQMCLTGAMDGKIRVTTLLSEK
ncbi:WD repeat-containing protein 91-like isoform X4 [Mytilus galloprovincialis]|uniref:WD repeat-containing protein 91-like isoform X3 n=1 Tax=Mytilus galloprovincialis TaxID=29158 RepID=UPI003F7C5C7C